MISIRDTPAGATFQVKVAELLNVARSSVTIAAGQSSRNKVIRVAGVSAAQVEARLLKGSSQ
ncbi:MAG: hypothetical protein ABSD98_16510 [Candidatus Korobacteraceae bacterium]